MYKDMMDTIGMVNAADPELGAAMERELTRQRENIELIASENIVSPAVMAAMGSVLTNKYAEGLPGKRYYGGCVYVTRWRTSPSSAPASCSAQSTPTSSPTPAHRPIWPSTSPCSIWAIPLWAWTCLRAVI